MSHFFAYLARLRLVQRWGLMRGEPENVAEHSFQVAVVAHALAIIGVRNLGREYDLANVALAALLHDASEVLTGDLPTPVKYANPEMRTAYKGLEQVATERLLEMLPEELQGDYAPLLKPPDPEVVKLVKAADKLCALLKCVQEVGIGNREFALAEAALRGQLKALGVPEAYYFLEHYGASFSLSLDNLQDAPPDGCCWQTNKVVKIDMLLCIYRPGSSCKHKHSNFASAGAGLTQADKEWASPPRGLRGN